MNKVTAQSSKNSGKWIVIEKIIAFILLAWSVFILYSVVSSIAGVYHSGFTKTGKVTIGSMLLSHHLILLVSIVCVFGSCLLLIKDKTGWNHGRYAGG